MRGASPSAAACSVALPPQRHRHHIAVTDTGPGIPEEDQQRLFEPFQQLDASIRRRYGGSGLGLTISKQFVEMHGGQMWLESPAGGPARPSASACR